MYYPIFADAIDSVTLSLERTRKVRIGAIKYTYNAKKNVNRNSAIYKNHAHPK